KLGPVISWSSASASPRKAAIIFGRRHVREVPFPEVIWGKPAFQRRTRPGDRLSASTYPSRNCRTRPTGHLGTIGLNSDPPYQENARQSAFRGGGGPDGTARGTSAYSRPFRRHRRL